MNNEKKDLLTPLDQAVKGLVELSEPLARLEVDTQNNKEKAFVTKKLTEHIALVRSIISNL